MANQAGAVQALLTAVDTASSGGSALCKSLALLKDLLEADSGKQAFAEASGAQQLRSVLKAASGADVQTALLCISPHANVLTVCLACALVCRILHPKLVEQAANAVKRIGLLAGCLDTQQLCRIGCQKLCMVLPVASGAEAHLHRTLAVFAMLVDQVDNRKKQALVSKPYAEVFSVPCILW